MRPVEVLAQIQELDQRAQRLREERQGAERRARGDAALSRLGQRRSQLEEESRHQASQLRQLELDAAQLSERARAHERAIYDGSVRHPADLQRRQHELTTLRARVGELEDEELALLERQEETERQLAATAAEFAAREGEVERGRSGDSTRAPLLDQELAVAEAERAELAAGVAPSQLRQYERIAARVQPALAKVVAGHCGGCRLPLPARILQDARGEQLVTCEGCQRILLP